MKNLDNLNILIVGVGGQGTLLASKFLGAVAVQCGKDVKVSEVHGMSQRGGSVVTCVKIGNNIHSPIIDLGEADIMLSFEQVEAVRWLPYLKKGGKIITGTQKISPMSVISGKAAYPENVFSALDKTDAEIISVDALGIAEKCGSRKAVNIVLTGVLASMIDDITDEEWLNVLSDVVPKKLYDINEKAFLEGKKVV